MLVAQAAETQSLIKKNQAKEEAAKLAKDEADAIERHNKDMQALLSDLAFETELTALNNDERERAIVLRNLSAKATDGER